MILRALLNTMILMKPDGDAGGGGGGSSGTGNPPAPDLAKALADMQTTNAALIARLEALEGKKKASADTDDDDQNDDLNNKARKMREANDKKNTDTKALEDALKFSMNAEQFLKVNQTLLPKTASDLFKTADKETYANAVEKASAIKAGLIQEFFSIQSNLDLLTPGLKATLEDYLKLTKNEKQERAHNIYSSVFEPTFEMLRRVKKAEALNKGYGTGGDSDDAYKNKLVTLSRKHYLGEKSNGT